jgi:stage V sporulation protein SpoVS
MPHPNRLSLSIAGTAAVALASLPLAVGPASAAKVTEVTTSIIGVVEASPNAQHFNLKPQSASTVLVARDYLKTQGSRKFVVPAFLRDLLELVGIQTTAVTAPRNPES